VFWEAEIVLGSLEEELDKEVVFETKREGWREARERIDRYGLVDFLFGSVDWWKMGGGETTGIEDGG